MVSEGTVDSDPRVLVAVMNNTRDFHAARDEGWYRIPLNRAPDQVGAEYLAFYHTAAFEREKWSVRHYAPIWQYRVVTRLDLLPAESSHPRAEDKYYRLDIGPLQALANPIPSRKLRRVTFIPTTLSCLLAAEDVQELWQRRKSEDRLWAAFRESTLQTEGRYQVGEERDAYEAGFVMPLLRDLGDVYLGTGHGLIVSDWFASYFAPSLTRDDLPSCLDMVRDAIRECSGSFAGER